MPLSVLDILGESLRGLRAHARFITGLVLPLLIVIVILSGLGMAAAFTGAAPSAGWQLVQGVLQLIQGWLSIVLSVNAARLVLFGRDSMGNPLREAVRLGRREWTVIGLSILIGLAMMLVTVIAGGVMGAVGGGIAVLTGTGDMMSMRAMMLAGFGGVLASMWVMLRLSLTIPAAVAGEGFGSLRVSWHLTRGRALRLALLMALTSMTIVLAMIVLMLLGALVAGAVGVIVALAAGWSMDAAGMITGLGSVLAGATGQIVGSLFLMAVLSGAFRSLWGMPDRPDDSPAPAPPTPAGPAPTSVPRSSGLDGVRRKNFGRKQTN